MTIKRYRIEWRPRAREDLLTIARFIGKDSPAQAGRFSQALHDKAKSLSAHPEMGRAGRPGLPDWLRELVVHPNYIIFYRVLSTTRTIEILRVMHAAQQVPSHQIP